jgi:hypothetical protein
MATAPWNNWRARWEATAFACRAKGGEVQELRVDPPALESEVVAVEKELGQPIPEGMRSVLLGFSRHVEVRWFLPEDLDPPKPFNQIFGGECYWDLNELVSREENRLSWVKECFPNPADSYDAVWHEKLGFASVGNGDVIAFDLRAEGQPVVYLSHDDGEGHGQVMGGDFVSFIDQHSRVGCPGLEDWQWLPFCDSTFKGINGDGESARTWRQWFGLELPA